MRSSFTKTRKALFKTTPASFEEEKSIEAEELNEKKHAKKASKKTESKNSFKQITSLFRIKKNCGKSSSNLPNDVLKVREDGNSTTRNRRSEMVNFPGKSFNEKVLDRSISYSDIKTKSQEGTCYIDSDKYLIVDDRRVPVVDGQMDNYYFPNNDQNNINNHSNNNTSNSKFLRQRKAQMSMRKAFGIYDDITSPDLICDLNITHSNNSLDINNTIINIYNDNHDITDNNSDNYTTQSINPNSLINNKTDPHISSSSNNNSVETSSQSLDQQSVESDSTLMIKKDHKIIFPQSLLFNKKRPQSSSVLSSSSSGGRVMMMGVVDESGLKSNEDVADDRVVLRSKVSKGVMMIFMVGFKGF